MAEIKLIRGATGIEAHTPDGTLIGHVCHSDEVHLILDFVLANFTAQAVTWASNVAATAQAAREAAWEASRD